MDASISIDDDRHDLLKKFWVGYLELPKAFGGSAREYIGTHSIG